MVLQHGAVKPGRIPNILNVLVVQYGNNQMVILTEVSLFVAPLSLPSLSSPDTDRCMHSKCSLRGHGIATQPACQLHVRVPWVQSWEYTYYINYISLSQICWYIIFYNYMYIWYIYIWRTVIRFSLNMRLDDQDGPAAFCRAPPSSKWRPKVKAA